MAGVTEIASLATVKEYLQIPTGDTTYDDILTTVFIPAATAAIEREVGATVARPYVETYNGGSIAIFLRQLPVLYVQSVQEGWGYYNWEMDYQQVNSQPAVSLWAYSLDRPVDGMITRRGPGNVTTPFVPGISNIRVAYVAGRETIPANIVMAFLMLLSYWFRQSQLRTVNQATPGFDALDDSVTRSSGIQSITVGLPIAVIELLKGNRRRPFIA